MFDQWQCVFANAVKPIGMRYPGNVKVLKKYLSFFLYLGSLLLKVIKNHPVVNSFHPGFLSVVNVKKLFPFPDEVCQANHFNAEVVFSRKEVDPGFLFFWKNFKKDHI